MRETTGAKKDQRDMYREQERVGGGGDGEGKRRKDAGKLDVQNDARKLTQR
jgi:hypothetical protein